MENQVPIPQVESNFQSSSSSFPKKSLLLIIVIILLLLSVSYNLYLNTKLNNQTSITKLTPTPTTATLKTQNIITTNNNETANWKTYENTKYGFSFKYLSDWVAKEDSTKGSTKIDPNTIVKIYSKIDEQQREDLMKTITFGYYDNPKNLSLKDLDEELVIYTDYTGRATPNLYSVSNKELMISGNIAYYQKEHFCEPAYCPRYIIPYKTKVFVITARGLGVGSEYAEYDKMFSEILSTFKILDQNQAVDINNWKTYTNKEINLIFKYPATWNLKQLNDKLTNGVDITGREGIVHAAWGSGFGGGCDLSEQQDFQIFGEVQKICHGIDEQGIESWNQIYKQLSPTITFSMYVQANAPYQSNRETTLTILSTFKFLK